MRKFILAFVISASFTANAGVEVRAVDNKV